LSHYVLSADDGTAADFREVVLDLLESQVMQMDVETNCLLQRWMAACSLSCVETVFEQLQRHRPGCVSVHIAHEFDWAL
jgi:hypothetical protein